MATSRFTFAALAWCLAGVVVLSAFPAWADTAGAAADGVEKVFAEIGSQAGASRSRIRLLVENQDAWFARWYIIEHARTSIDCTLGVATGPTAPDAPPGPDSAGARRSESEP
jgi:hypothetical protein